MNHSVCFNRQLPVRDVDVLVAGGGPAGVGAAIAAARDGAKTLLVEQMNCLGGLGTAGLVPKWAPFHDQRGNAVIRGLLLSIVKEMVSGMPHLDGDERTFDWVPIDFELLKRIYDRRVAGSGAEVLFMTQLAAVEAADGRVQYAVLGNKDALTAVRAKVYIDATGDGDLAARAGADYEKGDPATGEMQGCTPTFILTNVDAAAFFAWRDEGGAKPFEAAFRRNQREAIARGKANGDLAIVETECHISMLSPSSMAVNFSHLFGVDGTNAAQLSRSMIDGRVRAAHLAAFMRKYFAGCERADLTYTFGMQGVRETRRVKGEYYLTAEDYTSHRRFDDEVAINTFMMDVHMNAAQWKRDAAGQIDHHDMYKPYGPGEFHGVPWRCLQPAGLKNVLTAGRCISSDRRANGALRVMPMCVATGEAAGCAAAMMVSGALSDSRQVQPEILRDRLRAHGAYLPAVE